MRPMWLGEHLRFVPSVIVPVWDGMLSRKSSAVGQWADRTLQHRTMVKTFVLLVVGLQVMTHATALHTMYAQYSLGTDSWLSLRRLR